MFDDPYQCCRAYVHPHHTHTLYRGVSAVCEAGSIAEHVDDLRAQKEELEREEKELEEQYQRLRLCLNNITEDTYNDQYPHTHNMCTASGML